MKYFPGTNAEIYFAPTRWPKYSGTVTVLTLYGGDAGKLLRRRLPNFDVTAHVHAALFYKKERDRLVKAWNLAADRAAVKHFGRPFQFTDYKISGIGREEFTEKEKNRLREYAQDSSRAGVIAQAHWNAAGKRSIFRG